MNDVSAALQQHRPYLFHLAYSILGARAEAEEIVQDVIVRVWEKTEREHTEIQNLRAYCGKSVVNRALTRKEAMQREIAESYWGVWLPEPLMVTFADSLPDGGAEASVQNFDTPKAVSLGLLRLMEILTPLERAVYVLVDLFDEPYRKSAEMLEITEANARKIMERARTKLESGRKRFSASRERHAELFQAFAMAAQEGRYEALRNLLKEDVVMYSDGGGKVVASRIPVHGREKNIQALRNIAEWAAKNEPSTWIPSWVNGRLGAIATHIDTGEIIAVLTMEADKDGITEMYSVRNPDKIKGLVVTSL